jgi:CMP-N-acetylneuraminic acid synthetase
MIRSKKILAIIPARAGSKGLPGKNSKCLAGKPLIAWTIEAARGSRYIDEIVVSTDSHAIARLARKFGAEVPFMRPAPLAGDTAKMMDVVLHCLGFFQKNNDHYEIIVLLQPTSPLRRAADIDAGIELFIQKKAQAVLGVAECEHSPLWAATLPRDLNMKDFSPAAWQGRNRQALDTYYRINGALYVADSAFLQKNKSWVSAKTYAHIMSRARSIDIDTREDFIVAEAFLRTGLHKKQ